jgi:hypothetical protein
VIKNAFRATDLSQLDQGRPRVRRPCFFFLLKGLRLSLSPHTQLSVVAPSSTISFFNLLNLLEHGRVLSDFLVNLL